jgi:hypothetical protein
MKIISKQHDYYDGCSKSGIDEECLYLRKNETIDIKNIIKESSLKQIGKDTLKRFHDYIYESFYIIFCGNVYPVLMIDNEYFFSKEEVMNRYETEKPRKRKYSKYFRFSDPFDKNELDFLFGKNPDLADLNLKLKCPVLKIKINEVKNTLVIEKNPLLKDVNFFQVKNTFSAWQEIYSYLSGVLGSNEKPISKIPDKYKILQHGFDKWSFRKKGKKA